MIPIPKELLEQIEKGNVLLFIGERIARDAQGQVVLDRLAAQLAARCEITNVKEYTFPEVAQTYEDKIGHQALVQFVRDQLEALGDETERAHRLIAGLTDCNVLATTCLDRRLEMAFKEANRPLNTVIGNLDVAFGDERKVQLFKLRGSVEQAESLMLTEDKYETFFEDQASISVVLQGYLARKTILFVGFDLADSLFKRLYRKVTAPLDKYARRAYAFGETPPPKVSRWCKRHGIDVVESDATVFLTELTQQLAARTQPPIPAISAQPIEEAATPLPERLYKLLDYYEAKDTDIFFGRRDETQTLASLIHAHRLVLLYGASGVGKTSLMLAGVVPRLESAEPSYETLYVRALDDPTLVIHRTIRRRLPEADLPKDSSLVDLLDTATQTLGCTLVIVLDQFEEFFIRSSPQSRAAFIAELGALYDARDVHVKVVLSLREDWLASVNEVETRIPDVFRTRYRLLPLTRPAAAQAITGPVQRMGMHYEETLIEQLLDDLWHDGVMPPQLQIVCNALYGARGDGNFISLTTYEELGGAQTVLRDYLVEELRRFPPQERALVRGLLEEMITSHGTRAVKSLGEMASALDVDAQELQSLLNRLVKSRLIRPVELKDGQINYEIAHEYLVQDLDISAESKQRKRAQEWLQQSLKDWRASRRAIDKQKPDAEHKDCKDQVEVLIDSQRLLEIETQYDFGRLRIKDHDAFEFLLLSALRSGQRIDHWIAPVLDIDIATACVTGALLDPHRSQSAARALQISQEFLDDNWSSQLAQELESRYRSLKTPERKRLVDPLWELKRHLPASLRAQVTFGKALKQVALHTREVIIAFAMLILTSLTVGGYFLYRESQGGVWTQYDFNEVGDVSHIAVEPENEHVLWALVAGGRYGRALHRSVDGGDSWELILEETTRYPVTKMVIGLGDHDQPLVYMATLGLGVYVFDRETGTIELRNAGLPSYKVPDLLIDPQDHKTIYLGTGDKYGIYKSADFGESWDPIGGNELSNESIISIAAFANPRRIYVLTDEDRVWFSDDGGSDWDLAVPEGCDPEYPQATDCDLRSTLYGKGRITSLAADRQNRLLYAATTTRFIGVLDEKIWTVRFIPEEETPQSVMRVIVTGGDEPLLYVSVRRKGGASLYRSRDRGQTWDLITARELSRNGPYRLVTDPTSSDRLYVATGLGAVRTLNRGKDWSLMALDFPPTAVTQVYAGDATDAPLYAVVSDAIYRSDTTDANSLNWERADYGLDVASVRELIGDPRNPNMLYAGVYSPRQWSVFITRDGGQNWELLGLPPRELDDDTMSLALAVLDGEHAILYAGTNGSGILRTELGSEDEEIKWTRWSGAHNIHKVLVPDWDPNVAYALVEGRTLIRTTDTGLTWTTLNEVPITAPVSGLEAGNDSDTLYMSMRGGGVLYTVNGGETWVSVGEGLPDLNIVSLAVDGDSNDVLYVVTEAGVVYTSMDAGGSWENIRENLDVTGYSRIIVRKSGTPKVILASESGIYYYTRNKFLGFKVP